MLTQCDKDTVSFKAKKKIIIDINFFDFAVPSHMKTLIKMDKENRKDLNLKQKFSTHYNSNIAHQ